MATSSGYSSLMVKESFDENSNESPKNQDECEITGCKSTAYKFSHKNTAAEEKANEK